MPTFSRGLEQSLHRVRRIRIETYCASCARARAREIIEEFSQEMPQRVLPEKCQWRYRLLMLCSADGEAIQTSLSA
jgi:hypothetical protein